MTAEQKDEIIAKLEEATKANGEGQYRVANMYIQDARAALYGIPAPAATSISAGAGEELSLGACAAADLHAENRGYPACHPYNPVVVNTYLAGYTAALAAAPASVTSPVEPPKWIDCADRMPEAVEPVMALSVIPGDSRVYIARWMPHASPARWWLRDTPEQLAVVTHWMPLPATSI